MFCIYYRSAHAFSRCSLMLKPCSSLTFSFAAVSPVRVARASANVCQVCMAVGFSHRRRLQRSVAQTAGPHSQFPGAPFFGPHTPQRPAAPMSRKRTQSLAASPRSGRWGSRPGFSTSGAEASALSPEASALSPDRKRLCRLTRCPTGTHPGVVAEAVRHAIAERAGNVSGCKRASADGAAEERARGGQAPHKEGRGAKLQHQVVAAAEGGTGRTRGRHPAGSAERAWPCQAPWIVAAVGRWRRHTVGSWDFPVEGSERVSQFCINYLSLARNAGMEKKLEITTLCGIHFLIPFRS